MLNTPLSCNKTVKFIIHCADYGSVRLFNLVFFSFQDGGNKAKNKIWELLGIQFDEPNSSMKLTENQEEEIVKTKLQVRLPTVQDMNLKNSNFLLKISRLDDKPGKKYI